jgi:hypothetical protein
MVPRPFALFVPTLAIVAIAGAARSADKANVDAIISGWPPTPQKVARETIAKYGPPHEATAGMLLWHRNGPWKHTILYRDEVSHEFPMKHTDLLEQFIDYEFYAKTAMAFKQGKKDSYTQGLQFAVSKGGTVDPDKPMPMK